MRSFYNPVVNFKHFGERTQCYSASVTADPSRIHVRATGDVRCTVTPMRWCANSCSTNNELSSTAVNNILRQHWRLMPRSLSTAAGASP